LKVARSVVRAGAEAKLPRLLEKPRDRFRRRIAMIKDIPDAILKESGTIQLRIEEWLLINEVLSKLCGNWSQEWQSWYRSVSATGNDAISSSARAAEMEFGISPYGGDQVADWFLKRRVGFGFRVSVWRQIVQLLKLYSETYEGPWIGFHSRLDQAFDRLVKEVDARLIIPGVEETPLSVQRWIAEEQAEADAALRDWLSEYGKRDEYGRPTMEWPD
jgi:hypothetical protein